MSTFKVDATLIHPDRREQLLPLELLVDTGATYTLLPIEIVAELGLSTPYARRVELASGEHAVYRVGEVRIRLAHEEMTTIFFAGPLGSVPLLGAVTLEQFGLAADPARQRLFPVPPLL